jgi:cell wall-associated NlpC family hydrolase
VFRTLCALLLPALLLAPSVSSGDARITIDLSSPAPTVDRASRAGSPRSQSLPSRHSDTPRESVIGRLGVASSASTIRARHSSRGHVLVSIPAGTYLALTGDYGDWYGVLMSDRSTGWVSKSNVQLLQYEVVSPDAQRNTQSADASSATDSALLSSGQRSVLQVAYSYLGLPYRYGGESATGIDCSAFVQQCFSSVGVRLPRTAAEQSRCGMPVTQDQLQTADRLYFASRNGNITHTGIYIGNGYFIHASSSRHSVAISRLSEPLYARMYAGARR